MGLGEPAPADEGESRFHAAVDEAKRRVIREAIVEADGEIVEAARLLGLHPNYLHRLLNTLNLRPCRAPSEGRQGSLMRLEAGEHIGPYVVVQKVGSGGMGDVYRARDTRLNRLVAIKVISCRRRRAPTVAHSLCGGSPRHCRAEPSTHLRAVRYRVRGGTALPGDGAPSRVKHSPND